MLADRGSGRGSPGPRLSGPTGCDRTGAAQAARGYPEANQPNQQRRLVHVRLRGVRRQLSSGNAGRERPRKRTIRASPIIIIYKNCLFEIGFIGTGTLMSSGKLKLWRTSQSGGNIGEDDEFGTDEDWNSVDADQDGIPDKPRPKEERPVVTTKPPRTTPRPTRPAAVFTAVEDVPAQPARPVPRPTLIPVEDMPQSFRPFQPFQQQPRPQFQPQQFQLQPQQFRFHPALEDPQFRREQQQEQQSRISSAAQLRFRSFLIPAAERIEVSKHNQIPGGYISAAENLNFMAAKSRKNEQLFANLNSREIAENQIHANSFAFDIDEKLKTIF
ncbi:hypothetical protein GHT06_017481 [Daphnia sinensis]|uniref:Uncharacterized protein n=1 Tax=Daphnia sinensis TaxID=1820382 RepID=A0AAD5PTW1_9CRUS|nr:hypothetical protein GHT06_017481 [Daphnia sinensis]